MSRRLAQSTIRWADLKARMPSKSARQLYDATEGACKKHVEEISTLEPEKPAIDWESYAQVIKGHSDVVSDFKAKYNHLVIPYPNDAEGRMGAAQAKDLQIKEIRDLVLRNVSLTTIDNNKDRLFFRRLPDARSMTEEMYMEAFPRRAEVEPKEPEELVGEIDTVKEGLAEFAKKTEDRKKYE